MVRGMTLMAASLAAVLAAGCTPAADKAPTVAAATGAVAPVERKVATIAEAFLTSMTPADNIDSPASWQAPDGKTWLIATAKATDKLVVYDGSTGQHLRDVGSAGTGLGQFDRPNGIAVTDDLLWIVERDNHRVQVLSLPDFAPLATFGADDLRKPYGLWVDRRADGYSVYVTDSWDNGEDAQGKDILRYQGPGNAVGQHRRYQRSRRAARGRIDLG
jgi:3-phytase